MTFWKTLWENNKNLHNKEQKIINNQPRIILSDFYHNKTKITIYISNNKSLDLYALEKLCDTVGWVRRPIKKVKLAITNSFLIISLFYKKNNQTELIAFARVTSDSTFNATIWDVVVHPEFQRKGFGKILIYEIIKQLRFHEINTITLFADPQVITFYKHLGFISDPDGVKGMFWYPPI